MPLDKSGVYRFYVPLSMRPGLKLIQRRKEESAALSEMLRESLRAYMAQRAVDLEQAKKGTP